jgi:hypothetical protein
MKMLGIFGWDGDGIVRRWKDEKHGKTTHKSLSFIFDFRAMVQKFSRSSHLPQKLPKISFTTLKHIFFS